MKKGEAPAVDELWVFMEKCRHSRSLLLAKKLGDWMMDQETRYRSLWFFARVHRMLKLGQPRKALHVYSSAFSTIGLPEEVSTYLNTQFGARAPELQTKLWPSSHGIALALQAWFRLDPSLQNVQNTYASFLRQSYDPSPESLNVPLPSLPDQVSFQTFIKAFVDLEKPQEALRIMHGMQSKGVVPNQHNWDTVVGGFAKAGQEQIVKEIVGRMRSAVQAWRAKTQASLIRTEDLEDAVDFSEKRFQSFFSSTSTLALDRVHSTAVVADANFLDQFTFDPPTIITYATVIRGFCLANKLDAAMQYKHEMYEARDVAGGRLYKWGTNAKADKALAILASMQKLHS